jgi:hypothetical protein
MEHHDKLTLRSEHNERLVDLDCVLYLAAVTDATFGDSSSERIVPHIATLDASAFEIPTIGDELHFSSPWKRRKAGYGDSGE